MSSPSGRTPSGSDDTPTGRPHVLVLGGGFGGIGAARKLKDADVDVTLVDKHDYHTFQPLLYQVATDLLETSACGHPLRDLFHEQPNVAVHEATVTGIDLARREVQFAEMAPAAYDYLVLALGARVNFFGVEGAEEHAFPMYTLADAVRLKEHVLREWEAADRDPALVDDGALNVVVVGGGPTGIESAGALAELYRSNFAEDYPGIAAGQGAHRPGRGRPGAPADVQARTSAPTPRRRWRSGASRCCWARWSRRSSRPASRSKSGHGDPRRTRWSGAPACRRTPSPTCSASSCSTATASRSSPTSASPATPRCSPSATSPGSPTRRRTTCCPSSARSRSRPGSTPARTSPGCVAGKDDRAVRLPRQGHDGDDRPGRRGGPDPRRPHDEGQGGVPGVGRGAPRAAVHRRGPGQGGRGLDVGGVHPRARRAGSR